MFCSFEIDVCGGIAELDDHELGIMEKQRIKCTPGIICYAMGIVRVLEWFLLLLLLYLVLMACSKENCVFFMNTFDDIILGQVMMLVICSALSFLCIMLLVMYCLNGHRAFVKTLLTFEKLYAQTGIVLMILTGIIGTWMAVNVKEEKVNERLGSVYHVQGQITASVMVSLLLALVYVIDLVAQFRDNYPFSSHSCQQESLYRKIFNRR